MSTHVVTTQRAHPDKVDDLIAILTEALPGSIAYDGCEAINLRRDQDDPTHIVSFTQWATRQHYVDYLAWRTKTGLTAEIAKMLTEPTAFEFFDDIVSVGRFS